MFWKFRLLNLVNHQMEFLGFLGFCSKNSYPWDFAFSWKNFSVFRKWDPKKISSQSHLCCLVWLYIFPNANSWCTIYFIHIKFWMNSLDDKAFLLHFLKFSKSTRLASTLRLRHLFFMLCFRVDSGGRIRDNNGQHAPKLFRPGCGGLFCSGQ